MTSLHFLNQNVPDPQPAAIVRGQLGSLCTRLAENRSEVKTAQHIRYKVFCEELNAKPNLWNRFQQRDEDRFDEICDHLLMFDRKNSESGTIVGTQRFQVADRRSNIDNFYSSAEFEISELLDRHPGKRFMELGRSCILPDYRSRRTMELLWHGTWQYALQKNTDVMFGCASFQASDPTEIADELGFLSGIDIGEEWRVGSGRSDKIELQHFRNHSIEPKSVIRKLPPLVKGYLRLGAGFSNVAVPDKTFGTIDVLVVLPMKLINPRYIAHYGSEATRHDR